VDGLLAKGAEQSDGGPPQCGNKIYRYAPSGGLARGPAESLGPDIIEGIRRIKAQHGPDVILSGSSTLTSTLLEHGLADEVLLVVFPVLLGTGKRIFADGTPPRSFELVSTKALASGVILSAYKPNGPLRTGAVGG
jgi:hypothetical protein